MFMDGTVEDDFADEISEILSNRSESLKSYINQLAKENNIVSN